MLCAGSLRRKAVRRLVVHSLESMILISIFVRVSLALACNPPAATRSGLRVLIGGGLRRLLLWPNACPEQQP